MPTFELSPQIMREIIMDHYSSPRHKGLPSKPEAYTHIHAGSDNCVDDFDVYLEFADGKVADALWEGVACAISSASTDIMCDRLIGMTAKDALYVIEQYLAMIAEKEYDADALDEAIVFMNTGKQAARIHCATMGWDAMKELLEEADPHDGR